MSIVDDFSEIAKGIAKLEENKKLAQGIPAEQRELVYWTTKQLQNPYEITAELLSSAYANHKIQITSIQPQYLEEVRKIWDNGYYSIEQLKRIFCTNV